MTNAQTPAALQATCDLRIHLLLSFANSLAGIAIASVPVSEPIRLDHRVGHAHDTQTLSTWLERYK